MPDTLALRRRPLRPLPRAVQHGRPHLRRGRRSPRPRSRSKCSPPPARSPSAGPTPTSPRPSAAPPAASPPAASAAATGCCSASATAPTSPSCSSPPTPSAPCPSRPPPSSPPPSSRPILADLAPSLICLGPRPRPAGPARRAGDRPPEIAALRAHDPVAFAATAPDDPAYMRADLGQRRPPQGRGARPARRLGAPDDVGRLVRPDPRRPRAARRRLQLDLHARRRPHRPLGERRHRARSIPARPTATSGPASPRPTA